MSFEEMISENIDKITSVFITVLSPMRKTITLKIPKEIISKCHHSEVCHKKGFECPGKIYNKCHFNISPISNTASIYERPSFLRLNQFIISRD